MASLPKRKDLRNPLLEVLGIIGPLPQADAQEVLYLALDAVKPVGGVAKLAALYVHMDHDPKAPPPDPDEGLEASDIRDVLANVMDSPPPSAEIVAWPPDWRAQAIAWAVAEAAAMNQEPGDPDVITVPSVPRFLAVSEQDRVMKAVHGLKTASIEQIQGNTGMSHHRVVTVSAELTKTGKLARTGRGRCIRYQASEVAP